MRGSDRELDTLENESDTAADKQGAESVPHAFTRLLNSSNEQFHSCYSPAHTASSFVEKSKAWQFRLLSSDWTIAVRGRSFLRSIAFCCILNIRYGSQTCCTSGKRRFCRHDSFGEIISICCFCLRKILCKLLYSDTYIKKSLRHAAVVHNLPEKIAFSCFPLYKYD